MSAFRNKLVLFPVYAKYLNKGTKPHHVTTIFPCCKTDTTCQIGLSKKQTTIISYILHLPSERCIFITNANCIFFSQIINTKEIIDLGCKTRWTAMNNNNGSLTIQSGNGWVNHLTIGDLPLAFSRID